MAEQEFTTPSWLNNRFLEEVLSYSGDNVTVTGREAKPAVPRGQNYLSCLYRVLVEFSMGRRSFTRSLIVKCYPVGEVVQMLCSELDAFDKERTMYQKTLPDMERIFHRATQLAESLSTSKSLQCPIFSARSFHTTRVGTLILEDLASQGFVSVPRQSQLDLPHCLKVMELLGKFHAASIALHENKPDDVRRYKERLFIEQKRDIAKYMLEPTLKTLAREIKTWPGYERFAKKICNMSNVGVHRMIELFKPENSAFNVLNHGDFWITNIMFKYHSGTKDIQEVRLVDFQISRYCSPAIDIIYFMNTSPQEEVRLKYEDKLIEEYYTSLVSSLILLDLEDKVVPLQMIRNEIKDKAFYGVIIACTIFCNVLADDDVIPDFSKLTIASLLNSEGENPMKQAFSGTLFREQFQKLLLKFEREGLL
ncbi:uncharacterized protein [Anabrus simplex]|uniref:uncharacterized protein isoform X2 n=1 Tax=Anabrus simplex TaxID=316456 RepID=UPI0035A39B8C